MKKIFEIAKNNLLFNDIGYSDFCSMYTCLNCSIKSFEKKEIIFLAGNPIDMVGIVLIGSVQILKEDSAGDTVMLSEIVPGQMFGETFACAGISHSPVMVIANENSEILFVNFKKIVSMCKNSCLYHQKLIENMLKVIALKNLYLNQKIEILSKKTIRDKLLCFFEFERKGSKKFTINFSREDLAIYIASDRSAMCAELSRMQKDGVIKYSKNIFEIIS